MNLIRPLHPIKSDPKDKFIDVELNLTSPNYEKLGIAYDELIQIKFKNSGKNFDFGDFDNIEEISKQDMLRKLRYMRSYLEKSRNEEISNSLKLINDRYDHKKKYFDDPIKKLECELHLENIKTNRNVT